MNSIHLSFARLSLATLGFCALVAGGCDRLPKLKPSSSRHALVVIPSEEPRQVFTITVTDERYLTTIARRLGTTVEILIRDNDLADGTIQSGDQLQVRTTAKRLAAFKRLQLVRAERRRKRAEARRIKEAAAKVVKPKPGKHRRVRRRRRRLRRRSRAQQVRRRARRTGHIRPSHARQRP